jgi:hypothetical protein
MVEAAFTALGLAKCLPKREKRAIALRIAIKSWLTSQFGAKMARTCRAYPLDRRVLGFEIRQRIDGSEKNDHPYLLTVKADANGAWVSRDGLLGTQQECDLIRDLYLDRVQWFCPTTVGSLIKKAIVEEWHGTSLKSNGGLYFLPGCYLPAYTALANAIERGPTNPDSDCVMSAAVFNVAANPSVARDAIASLRAEIRAAADEINADLIGAHEMTEAGIASRKARLTMLAERAKGYADLFGTSLDDMRAMIAATETAVSMAELAEISA